LRAVRSVLATFPPSSEEACAAFAALCRRQGQADIRDALRRCLEVALSNALRLPSTMDNIYLLQRAWKVIHAAAVPPAPLLSEADLEPFAAPKIWRGLQETAQIEWTSAVLELAPRMAGLLSTAQALVVARCTKGEERSSWAAMLPLVA